MQAYTLWLSPHWSHPQHHLIPPRRTGGQGNEESHHLYHSLPTTHILWLWVSSWYICTQYIHLYLPLAVVLHHMHMKPTRIISVYTIQSDVEIFPGTVYFQQTTPLLIMSGFCVYSVASALFMFPALYGYLSQALTIYAFERADGAGSSADLVIQSFVRFTSIALIPVILCAGLLYLLVRLITPLPRIIFSHSLSSLTFIDGI